MTYRPLLERIGKGRPFRKPLSRSKTSSSSRSTDHHFASSRTSRRNVLLNDDDIPLNSNPRTESSSGGGGGDKHGFHRLENDSFVEPPRITVTTKISVSEDVRRRADAEERDVESGESMQ